MLEFMKTFIKWKRHITTKNNLSIMKEQGFLYVGGNDTPIAYCSDNNCPCNQTPLPRNEGYVYIIKRGSSFTGNVTCEQGARLRNLDLKSAHEDAKLWWKKGAIPKRESILNYDKNQVAPSENVKFNDLSKRLDKNNRDIIEAIANSLNNELKPEKTKFKNKKDGYLFKSPQANDSTYPVLIIPSSINKINKQTPPSKISAPTKPIFEKPTNWNLIFFLSWIGLAFFSIIFDGGGGSNPIEFFLMIIVVGVLGAFYTIFKHTKKADKAKDTYNSKLENYHYHLEKYKEKGSEEFSEKQIQEWRISKIKKKLKRAQHFTKYNRESAIGKTEDYFEKHLINFFGKEKIFTSVELGNFDRPYEPDFVYYNSDNNLHIDIEIDEMYEINGKQPIHYIGSDSQRNKFFTSKNWVVIRFSEEQIIRYPERCCKSINYAISLLTPKDNYLTDKFSYIADLPKFKTWIYPEAEKMAKKDYRATLLDEGYFKKYVKESA